MNSVLSKNEMKYLGVIRDVLSVDDTDRECLLAFMGSTILTSCAAESFENRELLDALQQLKWVRIEKQLLLPTRWLSKVHGLAEKEVWILRNLPNSSPESRSRNNYEWSDETDDFFEIFNLLKVNQIPHEAKVLDLCTGSGSIGIAIKALREDIDVSGVDINPVCEFDFAVNAFLNRLELTGRVSVGDLWSAVEGLKFDKILSVPPFSLRPPESTVSPQFDGGEFGDDISMRIIKGCHNHLNGPNATLDLLVYTLGNEDGSKLRIQEFIESQEAIKFKPVTPLTGKKVWRFKHSKVFSNGMPIEFMISRLGDPFKEEYLQNRSREEMMSEATRLERYVEWIAKLKRQGYTHLWYCNISGSLR
jgi:hypothetical protein